VAPKGFEFVVRADVDPQALGAELRRLRENCLVSASDLAERMGWSSQNVLRLERGGGGREPTISSVNLYVRMLGFELVLAGRRKKPPRPKSTRPDAGQAAAATQKGAGETSEDE
jgi:transcriptional regulator with XRE-family HTH domain